MRVLSLNWNYGMCSARYIYRKFAARCTTRLARSRSPTRRMHGIVGERKRSNCVVDMRYIYSLVNQAYFGGRNTSGHTRTTLRAGRNVGLRNARYNLTTSMQGTQSICISLTCSSNRALIRQLTTTMDRLNVSKLLANQM